MSVLWSCMEQQGGSESRLHRERALVLRGVESVNGAWRHTNPFGQLGCRLPE